MSVIYLEGKIFIGKSGEESISIYPKMANRHGLIAGATGTGKTVTLKVLAESFSDCGVPVFLADAKGDLSGMCMEGSMTEKLQERIQLLNLETIPFQKYPVDFWDIYGEKGIPLRTTISEMGPLLLSQILDLNATQTSVLTVLFQIADDEQLLLIDTKDLRAMLEYASEHASEYSSRYGNMSKQSLAAIVRAVVTLESQGGNLFFGEPALDIRDWIRTDASGKGLISVLDCQTLMQNPSMYAAFMLWLISELFETLPEVGDCEKPKMIFFFDEAHLLFENASKALLSKIEQVVKLIRSKGVGIYFITQSPKDIPDGVLSQLGNKIQHALHAYTPSEQKAIRVVADSFRANPSFKTDEVLTQLGIGEALISVLDENGIPTVVKRCHILPPQSMMGAVSEDIRISTIKESVLYSRYSEFFDRDSAYEFLQRKTVQEQEEKEAAKAEADALKQKQKEEAALQKQLEREQAAKLKKEQQEKEREERQIRSSIGKVASTAAGTIGRELGNEIGKTIGGSFGKRLGGNVGASLGRGILSTILKR